MTAAPKLAETHASGIYNIDLARRVGWAKADAQKWLDAHAWWKASAPTTRRQACAECMALSSVSDQKRTCVDCIDRETPPPEAWPGDDYVPDSAEWGPVSEDTWLRVRSNWPEVWRTRASRATGASRGSMVLSSLSLGVWLLGGRIHLPLSAAHAAYALKILRGRRRRAMRGATVDDWVHEVWLELVAPPIRDAKGRSTTIPISLPRRIEGAIERAERKNKRVMRKFPVPNGPDGVRASNPAALSFSDLER